MIEGLTSRFANNKTVIQAIEARLPKTQISSVNCKGFGGLCEVVAGPSLFYVDPQARFLLVGRLYDMETRQDITAARLLSLNPDLLVGGAARAAQSKESEDDEAQPEQSASGHAAKYTAAPQAPRTVSVASLQKPARLFGVERRQAKPAPSLAIFAVVTAARFRPHLLNLVSRLSSGQSQFWARAR